MWSAQHEEETAADPAAVWALWEDPARWPQWNHEIPSARLDGPLAHGATARVRFRRGIPVKFRIVEFEPGRSFTDEGRLPGARMGHEHVVSVGDDGTVRIRNRIYIDGPAARLYVLLMGRRVRRGLPRFVARERALAEGEPEPANRVGHQG